MGNYVSSRSKNTNKNINSTYEPFINNNEINIVDKKIEKELEYLRIEIKTLKDKNDRMEMRIARLDQLMQTKYQDLQNSVYNNNERINIITNDMESLLNNDKLLLDKLIEKNIVSTIQEKNENGK
jgi:hypothetical protein